MCLLRSADAHSKYVRVLGTLDDIVGRPSVRTSGDLWRRRADEILPQLARSHRDLAAPRCLARVKQRRVESMILTQEEERLLKDLNAADKSGRPISALNCSGVGLARLVAAGYVSDAASEGLVRVLYRITDAGKKELINLSFR